MSEGVRVYDSRQEAILAAMSDVAKEGGGDVWVHQADCAEIDGEDCDCEPERIEVGAAQ